MWVAVPNPLGVVAQVFGQMFASPPQPNPEDSPRRMIRGFTDTPTPPPQGKTG
jgi:hypothetical protein